MKRSFLAILAIVTLVVPALVVPPVYAQAQQTIAVGEVSDPGILPGSSFYFVKKVERTIQLAFAFNAPKRSGVTLEFAVEDALAIQKLCESREYLLAEEHCREYLGHFEEAIKWAERTLQEGRGNQELLEELKADHLREQQILAGVLQKMPDQRKEAVLNVIEDSSNSLENAISIVEGEREAERFRQELTSQFGGMDEETQLRIMERLGISDPESMVNHAPSIVSLLADEDRVGGAESCRVLCEAEDIDGDTLSYTWSASGGDISGTGSVVEWVVPGAEGNYTITVVVRDGYGGESRGDVIVEVVSYVPLVIEELVIIPEDPEYFRGASVFDGSYKILQNKSCLIECVISGGGGDVDYDWSVSAGEVVIDKSAIRWTAPYRRDADFVTIAVTVSDGHGGKATESVVFNVSDCAPCFS